MKDLSFTQEFLLCSLSTKGSAGFSTLDKNAVCLFAGALLELIMDGYITVGEKEKLTVINENPPEKTYLTELYNFIHSNKPMSLETLAEKYVFSTKNMEQLFRTIAISIVSKGCATEKKLKGFFGTRTLYFPADDCISVVIEKLRAEFLENGMVSDEAVVLGALLNKSGLIKKYFSAFEAAKLNDRITEIKDSSAGILVKKLVDRMDTWFLIFISCFINS